MNVLGKFRCKFKIIEDDGVVNLKKSKAICIPKAGRIVRNYKLQGKVNSYAITFKVQTGQIIKAGNNKNQLSIHILENNYFRDFASYNNNNNNSNKNNN